MAHDVQRNLDKAVQQERERLAQIEQAHLAKIKQVEEFLTNCDEEQLRFLGGVFSNGVGHYSKASETGIKVRNFDGGTRQRSWNVLLPAVEQAIETMDEISSTGIYESLKAAKFVFSTERAVSSIAAILRKLKFDGVLKEAPSWKRGTRPIVYKKQPHALKILAQRERSNVNPPGSLSSEVRRIIATLPSTFTTVRIIEMLRRDGFKFDTDTPGSSVNGVFTRLMKRGEIRIVSHGIGRGAHTYERTEKWRDLAS